MTTIIRAVVMVLALVITKANAQDFQGVATYKTQRSVDIKIDSTKMSSEMHQKMMDMMKKQFQKTFNLTFNKGESTYKEDESLDKPTVGGSGNFQVMVVGAGGGSDILYKNTKDNRYTNQMDAMGKIFLVKDDIEKIDWKLGSESKHIGEYLCYKATYTKEVEKPRVIIDTDSDSDENDLDKEPEMETITVSAWYTPQIPVNNGPGMYQGLPGLILEVHDGKLNIICSKIVLNPEDKVDIKEPAKGKEVNQEKYDQIMEKKAKEMMERYRPRNGRNGESIEISIGG